MAAEANCPTNVHEIVGFFSQTQLTTTITIIGLFAFLTFFAFIVYRRGLNIFGKLVIPSKLDRTEAITALEESKFHLKPDYIQKTGDDFCWFHAHKGAAMKFGGMTWNSGEHYQAYELFQTLLLSENIDSLEFVKSSIPSKVLGGIEKKLAVFDHQKREFTIYCDETQKNFLTTNLSHYTNLKLEVI